MAYPVASAPIDRSELRPRRRWYWIGGLLMVLAVVGAIAAFVIGFLRIDDRTSDFAKIEPYETALVTLDEGGYVIYTDSYWIPDVTVIAPDGSPVATERYSNDLSFTVDGYRNDAALTFDAPVSGSYTVSNSSDGRLSVGESIASMLVTTIVAPFVVGGVLGLAGLIVIIVTAVKRSRHTRELRALSAQHYYGQDVAPAVGAAPHYPLQQHPGTPPPSSWQPPSQPGT